MSLEEFMASLSGEAPPSSVTASLAAMWYDGKGDWEQEWKEMVQVLLNGKFR
jgi:hypothetical protein